jgi:hypothetical protein
MPELKPPQTSDAEIPALPKMTACAGEGSGLDTGEQRLEAGVVAHVVQRRIDPRVDH